MLRKELPLGRLKFTRPAHLTLVAAVLLAGTVASRAQSSPPTASPQESPATPHPQMTIPEKINPPPGNETTGAGPQRENPSDRLNRSEGVVKSPTDTDPGLVKPAPNVGTTPVIPPPGTPGGDPTVRPK